MEFGCCLVGAFGVSLRNIVTDKTSENMNGVWWLGLGCVGGCCFLCFTANVIFPMVSQPEGQGPRGTTDKSECPDY